MTDLPHTSHVEPPVPSPAASSRQTVWGMLLLCHKVVESRYRPLVSHIPAPYHFTDLSGDGWARHCAAATGHMFSNEMAHRILRHGVSGHVLVPLAELLDLSTAQLAPVLGVDRATARRYAQNDQPLPTHSAETVLRLAELEALSMDVFASDEAALGWLKTPHPLLDESPIDAAATSYGAQRVREILTAIKYGGVV